MAATMHENASRLDELISEFVLGNAPAQPLTALPAAGPARSAEAPKPKHRKEQQEAENEWETF